MISISFGISSLWSSSFGGTGAPVEVVSAADALEGEVLTFFGPVEGGGGRGETAATLGTVTVVEVEIVRAGRATSGLGIRPEVTRQKRRPKSNNRASTTSTLRSFLFIGY